MAVIYLVTVLCVVFASTLCNMLVIFFSELNVKLKTADKASVNLINGMHEGLLILSHETSDQPNQFLFCNKPAQKLITTFLGPIEKCQSDDLKNSKEI